MSVSHRFLPLLFLCLFSCAQSQAQTKIPVWIDTDPSLELGGHEVDDGFALIQAFHSPELEIRGVSIVFGNAPLSRAWPVGKEIVEKFGPKGLRAYKGAAGNDEFGKPTDASDALTKALQEGPLDILAIGPVTNVATVLKLHPELTKNVDQIIAVAGRRPGQRFLSGPKQKSGFRDFNFEMDPIAFQYLLDAKVPIVLAPWEISAKIWITRADLDRLDRGAPDARYLVPPSLDLLSWWQANVGPDGFNPFDTLAVGFLTSPQMFHCADMDAKIETAPDDTSPEAATKTKPYLLVSATAKMSRMVVYCSDVKPEFKQDLLTRILGPSH